MSKDRYYELYLQQFVYQQITKQTQLQTKQSLSIGGAKQGGGQTKRPAPISTSAAISSGSLFDPKFLQSLSTHGPAPGNLTLNSITIPLITSNTMARKFKDGDEVELIRTLPGASVPLGARGTVVCYEGGSYGVQFQGFSTSHGLHDLDGHLNSLDGYWVDVGSIELSTPLPPKTTVEFESVVTTDDNRRQILEVLEQANQGKLIFEKWGFNKTIEKGKGVPILFYGPPGTGKTLMAQAIADRQGCQLKVIGTADIQSSEPGQAERIIRETFERAKGKKVILLFDECDSLIFDRTAVGAILGAQVNELLSSLEKFDGITIFTTNRVETLDEAVDRRLALKLEFGMPDHASRVKIWQRMIPDECPVSGDIDFNELAAIEIAGGYIKNAVLRAARIAAAEDKPDEEKMLAHSHLLRALQEEGRSMVAFKRRKAGFAPVRLVGGPGPIQMNDSHKLTIKPTIVEGHNHD